MMSAGLTSLMGLAEFGAEHPVSIGILMTAVTVIEHSLFMALITWLLLLLERHTRVQLGFDTSKPIRSFLINVSVMTGVVVLAMISHLSQISTWALLFYWGGQFEDYNISFYHSAVNYTTLGYGDIVMAWPWNVLGAIEAGNGVLMFGVSTAIIFALVTQVFNLGRPHGT